MRNSRNNHSFWKRKKFSIYRLDKDSGERYTICTSVKALLILLHGMVFKLESYATSKHWRRRCPHVVRCTGCDMINNLFRCFCDYLIWRSGSVVRGLMVIHEGAVSGSQRHDEIKQTFWIAYLLKYCVTGDSY